MHTRAPWTIAKGPYGSLSVGPAELRHPGRDSTRLEERLAQRAADAALIAAAPEMLAALQRIVGEHRPGELMTVGQLAMARAAIAKAEGRDNG